jgi:hypothetical protein
MLQHASSSLSRDHEAQEEEITFAAILERPESCLLGSKTYF